MYILTLSVTCVLLPVIFLVGISTNVPPKEESFPVIRKVGNVGIFVQFLIEINSKWLQAEKF